MSSWPLQFYFGWFRVVVLSHPAAAAAAAAVWENMQKKERRAKQRGCDSELMFPVNSVSAGRNLNSGRLSEASVGLIVEVKSRVVFL